MGKLRYQVSLKPTAVEEHQGELPENFSLGVPVCLINEVGFGQGWDSPQFDGTRAEQRNGLMVLVLSPNDLAISFLSLSVLTKRSAAAAYHIPNQVDFACDMKHPDVSPQRAEIFALLLACRHFTSPTDVASDCQTVVHGDCVLQSPEKNAVLSQCDNQDLWTPVAAELRVD